MTESTINMTNKANRRAGMHLLARYSPALEELGLVVARSLFLPLVVGMVAWELRDGYDTSSLSGALCHSAFYLLPALFMTRLLSRSLRVGGLVKKFYGWSDDLICGLRACVETVQWGVLPLTVMWVVLHLFEQGRWHDSLGRVLFVGAMLLLGWGLWRLATELKKWKPLAGDAALPIFANRFLIRGAIVTLALATIAICAMSLLGYQYGAEQMAKRHLASVLLGIFVSVMTGFASHMLLVTQFKIKYRRLIASRGSSEKNVDTDSIDIKEISAQVNRLLSVLAVTSIVILVWNVWGSVFPANSYLEQVQLWKGPLNDAGESHWVTLRHVLSGLALIGLTFVLSRNLPGLLEITLLDRLPLDRGGRYAISFVCRYTVGIAGILLTCQLLGFSWKSLQWLAAGLTVGLGFGLQEIFANLVSGIIILIERPVRVGDYVTVNGISGTVIRMQLRATTIQDSDNRELIVPNKRFITEDVMNWTLTDQISRMIFKIGVAYGSDTELVVETLRQVANEHPCVVPYPEPVIVFSQFGDSTLNFELRVHIPSRDVYTRVQHEVNMRIDQEFRDKQIEIAFPQTDLHIRSSELGMLQPVLSGVAEDVDGAKFDEVHSKAPVISREAA